MTQGGEGSQQQPQMITTALDPAPGGQQQRDGASGQPRVRGAVHCTSGQPAVSSSSRTHWASPTLHYRLQEVATVTAHSSSSSSCTH